MNKKLLFSLLLLSLLIIAGCSTPTTQDLIDKGAYKCTSDADCVITLSKGKCPCDIAINKQFLDDWNKIKEPISLNDVLCERCPPKSSETKCVENKCEIIYKSEVDPIPEPDPEPAPEPEPQFGTLYGRAMKSSGNCMPQIVDDDVSVTSCSTLPVQNRIFIYEVKTLSEMTGEYLNVHSEMDPPEVITPNTNGKYAASLASGEYSVFIEHEGMQYCNTFGGGPDGDEACYVKIEAGDVTEFNPKIDLAVY